MVIKRDLLREIGDLGQTNMNIDASGSPVQFDFRADYTAFNEVKVHSLELILQVDTCITAGGFGGDPDPLNLQMLLVAKSEQLQNVSVLAESFRRNLDIINNADAVSYLHADVGDPAFLQLPSQLRARFNLGEMVMRRGVPGDEIIVTLNDDMSGYLGNQEWCSMVGQVLYSPV